MLKLGSKVCLFSVTINIARLLSARVILLGVVHRLNILFFFLVRVSSVLVLLGYSKNFQYRAINHSTHMRLWY